MFRVSASFGLLLFAVLVPAPAIAATWTVGTTGTEDFTSLQTAIDTAALGDELVLSAGVHALTAPLDFAGKELTVRGAGIGLTRVDTGCHWVLLDNLDSSALIEDLAFYSDTVGCSSPSVIGSVSSQLTVRRVAVLGVEWPNILLWGPFGAAASGGVEDLSVEQLGQNCPSGAKFSLRDRPGPTTRVAVFGKCFAQAQFEQGEVNISNLLVQGAHSLGGFYADSEYVTVSHMTVVHDPVSGPQTVIEVDPIEMPTIRSSVWAGSSFTTLWLACVPPWVMHQPLDLAWTVNYPLPPSGYIYADTDLGTCFESYTLPYPLNQDGNVVADPMFANWIVDGDPTNDDLCPGPGSPLIDAGDPSELDPDGTRSDIGAFGGPNAFTCDEVKDADGDNYRPITGDCDDTNPDRFPFNPEVPCDGVDQDCDGVDVLVGCPGDDDDDDSADDDDSGDDDDSVGDDDDSVGDDDDSADDDDSVGDDDSADDDDSVGDDDDSGDVDDSPQGACGGCSTSPAGATLWVFAMPLVTRRRRT